MRLRDMNLAHRLYASLSSRLDQASHDSVPVLDILLPLVMLASAQAGKPQSEVYPTIYTPSLSSLDLVFVSYIPHTPPISLKTSLFPKKGVINGIAVI